jgi:hypothetical protein
MIITNNFSRRIYWRTFNHDDTAYVAGREDGILNPGQSVSTAQGGEGDLVKLEKKDGGVLADILVPAWNGYLFSNMASVRFTNSRKLEHVSGAVRENWTRVVVYFWAGNTELGRTYTARFNPPRGRISWRRYSALPPFYTYGDHDMSQPFSAVMAMPFTEFWFNLIGDVSITWTPALDIRDVPPYEPYPRGTPTSSPS